MKKNMQAALVKYAVRLVIVFAGISVVLFFVQSINNFYKFAEIDFTSYIRASQNFWDGQNPYLAAPRRYSYPLFLAVVLYPLTWLQSGQILRGFSIGLWSLGAYISFFAAIMAGWKVLAAGKSEALAVKTKVIVSAIMVVLLHPFLQNEFLNGQVNLYVMALAVGFFFMLEKDRQFPAALFLAMAASIKVGPGICLLYVLFTRQYRTIGYFVFLMLLFNIGLPYLVNDQSPAYYDYYRTVVLADAAKHDFLAGWRSFSIISTLSYLFGIHWNPMVKMTAIMGLAVVLVLPIYFMARPKLPRPDGASRLNILGALTSIIPLAFPISEPHHLLILSIPYIIVIYYWYRQLQTDTNILKDRLSMLFLAVVVGLQFGHGLKDTPIRLFCLLGLYTGLLLILNKSAGFLPRKARV